jgi:hypothetical protein
MLSQPQLRPRRIGLAIAMIAVCCWTALPSFAKDITVTRSTDRRTPTPRGCTFREAIATANTGSQVGGCVIANPQDSGFVTIHLRSTTYTFDGTLDDININSPDFVTVLGQAGSTLTSTVRDIQINIGSQGEVVFRFLSLKNAPMFIAGGGFLGVDQCEVQNVLRQGFSGKGGAFLVADGFPSGPQGGELDISNSWIHNNGITTVVGGAVYAGVNSNVFINKSTLSNNLAAQGGALFVAPNATVEVWQSTISGNMASKTGGGIHVEEGANYVELRASTIMENHVTDLAPAGTDPSVTDGGGLYVAFSTGPISLIGTLIAKNTSVNQTGNDCRSSIRFDGTQYVNSIQSSGGNFIGEVGGNSTSDPCPIDVFNDGSTFDNFGVPGNPQVPDVCGFGSITGPTPVFMPAYLPALNGNLIDIAYEDPNLDTDQLGRTRAVLALPPNNTPEDVGAVERQGNDPACTTLAP